VSAIILWSLFYLDIIVIDFTLDVIIHSNVPIKINTDNKIDIVSDKKKKNNC